MSVRYSRFLPTLSLVGDFVILNLLFVSGFLVFFPEIRLTASHIIFFIYLNFNWFMLVLLFEAYHLRFSLQKKAIIITYVQIIVFHFFLFLLFFQIQALSYYPRDFIKYLFPVFLFSILIWKFTLYYIFLLYRKKGNNNRNVIIVGNSLNSKSLYSFFINNTWAGYHCLGFVCQKTHTASPYLGSYDSLGTILKQYQIDEIFLDWSHIPHSEKEIVQEQIADFAIKTSIVPDLGNFTHKFAQLTKFGHIPVIEVHPGPLTFWYNQLVKRLIDIVISALVIVSLISWLTPVLFIIYQFSKNKRVFFTQKRTTINGGEFLILKYRSMAEHSPVLNQSKFDNQRVTRIGKFLRRTNIDEIPQFINVFLGQMSIVGPRPHMLKHTEQYRKVVRMFMLRHIVKPGITGHAQVNGYRGEIRKISDIQKRVELDVEYLENWSIILDIKIIFKTILISITGQQEA